MCSLSNWTTSFCDPITFQKAQVPTLENTYFFTFINDDVNDECEQACVWCGNV